MVTEFAPHTRGSTLTRSLQSTEHRVCPAHAGVYRPRRVECWSE